MSTNLLTWHELYSHEEAGRLRLWLTKRKPEVGPNDRALYMLPAVHDAVLKGPWPGIRPGESARKTQERRQAMRMVLERFILGNHLLLEIDISELGSKVLRPEHRGFWCFRSGLPMTQTRLLGFFARPGAFVATGFQGRDTIGDYRQPFAENSQRWRELTGNRPFLSSPYPVSTAAHLSEYLERKDD